MWQWHRQVAFLITSMSVASLRLFVHLIVLIESLYLL